jgi:hypothetical protein
VEQKLPSLYPGYLLIGCRDLRARRRSSPSPKQEISCPAEQLPALHGRLFAMNLLNYEYKIIMNFTTSSLMLRLSALLYHNVIFLVSIEVSEEQTSSIFRVKTTTYHIMQYHNPEYHILGPHKVLHI